MRPSSRSDKVLIIGSNPSVRSPDMSAFHPSTRSGKVLASWLNGIDPDRYVVINLLPKKTDDNRPINISDIDVTSILEMTQSYRDIIALGNNVSSILSKINVKHTKFPHPSGMNRKLNDSGYRSDIIKHMKELIS